MKYFLKRGLSTVLIVLILSVLTIMTLAGMYGFQIFLTTKRENSALRNQIQEQLQNTNLEQISSDQTGSDELGTSSNVKNIHVSNKESVEVTSRFTNTPVQTNELPRQTEMRIAIEEALAEQKKNEKSEQVLVQTPVTEQESTLEQEDEFKVIAIRQSAFRDEYGGVYGAYEIEISIKATEKDILIPPSTSNTVGAGEIGFSYTIVGDSFRGSQQSKVSCGLKSNDYCKIPTDGRARNITVTIYLIPNADSESNYAINFEKCFTTKMVLVLNIT